MSNLSPNHMGFNSEGATRVVLPDSIPRLMNSFGDAAKKPESTINDELLLEQSGQKIADNRFKDDPNSIEGQKAEEEKKRRDYATRYFIRGLELSTSEVIDRLMDQASDLRSLASMGDDYFGREPTDEDMLYVTEQNGQIAFASKGEEGARIASADDKAALEEDSQMCIIGLSSDEVGIDSTGTAFIKSHALEEERMNESIAEIEDTAEKLRTGELTPDELPPSMQYLVAPDAVTAPVTLSPQPPVLSGNLLPPLTPPTPMS